MKRTVLIALFVSISLMIFSCFPLDTKSPVVHITKDSCAKIENGMTEAEVQGIVCATPGDYLNRPIGFVHLEYVKDGVKKEWRGEEGFLFVWFDENGKVNDKDFVPRWWDAEGTLLDKIKRWL